MSDWDWPKPDWTEQRLRCGKCGAEWCDWMPQGVRAPILIAALHSVRCPQCHSKRRVMLVLTATDSPAR